MKIFVCPRDWTFATERFTPDHMVSLQNPGADISELRPPWISPENHYVGYFYDIDTLDHPQAPSEQDVKLLIDWLAPRCGPGSENRFIIHCDAGLGRSTAAAYVAWSIYFGAGRERKAFDAMKESCLQTQIIPNSIVVAHTTRPDASRPAASPVPPHAPRSVSLPFSRSPLPGRISKTIGFYKAEHFLEKRKNTIRRQPAGG